MHLFATREHNKMAAVGYVPAMKEMEREKNRKTLVENLCKTQGKAAAALEFKISWEKENRGGVQRGREVSEGVASLVLRFHLLHKCVSVCVCVCAFAQLVYQTLLQLGKHSRRRLCSRFPLSRSWGSELGLCCCSSCCSVS